MSPVDVEKPRQLDRKSDWFQQIRLISWSSTEGSAMVLCSKSVLVQTAHAVL